MFNTKKTKIITRFPPSPTGWFHIGNARTALFNYFFTKKNGGELLFRLEDTDRERSKDEYSLDIVEGLKWLGVDIDYNKPYKQSEHGQTYKKYLEKIIADGKAYISKEEVKEEGQRAEVIRLRNPGTKVSYDDMIRGHIEVDTTELGDFIIAKSITEPLYHFAVVVDDFEMGVTHVIRGEDGIYNTPRQILIEEAIGATRPIYGHMPFILNEDRSKLSKRKQGELVSLTYYRKQGYLPEAMVNFLAFCGWNPGGTEEIMSMNEIIEKFDIMKVQKAGAIFNREKLNWINKEYIKKLPQEILSSSVLERLQKVLTETNKDIFERALPFIVERISYFGEIETLCAEGDLVYFFVRSSYGKEKLLWKQDKDLEVARRHLEYAQDILGKSDTDTWKSVDSLKALFWSYAEENGKGSVLWPLRYSLSGRDKSPDPFSMAYILGREEALIRIKLALDYLS
ncbi:MAG: glutamate--tRNA ligase family protein [Candidatus Paceibacterota bacterium]|jgi:glutamyl-tRNA synthetase